jgi:hypothetical protein
MVLDDKLVAAGKLLLQVSHWAIRQRHHPPTFGANEVMAVVAVAGQNLIVGLLISQVDRLQLALVAQSLQSPVDRGQANAMVGIAQLQEDLLGREGPQALLQDFQDQFLAAGLAGGGHDPFSF